jgi:hypothetical protein
LSRIDATGSLASSNARNAALYTMRMAVRVATITDALGQKSQCGTAAREDPCAGRRSCRTVTTLEPGFAPATCTAPYRLQNARRTSVAL